MPKLSAGRLIAKAHPKQGVRQMVEIIWNPEVVPDDALVLYVHQHSVSPLTKTLGYFGPSNSEAEGPQRLGFS